MVIVTELNLIFLLNFSIIWQKKRDNILNMNIDMDIWKFM